MLSLFKFKGEIIRFYSDSMSTLDSLNRHTVKSFLIQDTIFKLSCLARKNNVSLHWVRAHVGTHGNEHADSLKKRGALEIGPLEDY